MYATTTAAAATAALQMQPTTTAGMSSPNSRMPVLFAVPAPSSVGKNLLCLCRKIYWTSGALMYCAYSPVTKDEAAIFLKDPSIINILSNPVTGSNLLTIASNGVIIGVQQTVGYLANQHPSSAGQQNYTETIPTTTSSIHRSGSPQEASKAPMKSPALPKSTSTPTKAQQAVISNTGIVTTSTSMMPKINAVFTLADTGLTNNTVNEHAANADLLSNMTRIEMMKDSVKETSLKAPKKDCVIQQSTLIKEHHQDLTTDIDRATCLNTKIPAPAELTKYVAEAFHQSHQAQKIVSAEVHTNNLSRPVERSPPQECMDKDTTATPNVDLPNKDVAMHRVLAGKEPVGPKESMTKKPSAEQPSKAQSDEASVIPTIAPKQNQSNREEPLKAIQKMSTEFDSYFSNMTINKDKQKVPPLVLTKNPQGPGFISSGANTASSDQSEHVNLVKEAKVAENTISFENIKSKILTDVQNKVCHSHESDHSQSRGIKRKSGTVKHDEPVDKKKKNTKTTLSEKPPLKVKFSWTKRWTVEGGETYFRYEPDFKRNSQGAKVSKVDDQKSGNVSDDPEISFKVNPYEEFGEDELVKSKPTKAIETEKVKTPVKKVRVKTPVGCLKVKLGGESVIVNNPGSFRFAYDNTKDKLISINNRIPQLKPMEKLTKDKAICLGCVSSCPSLPAKVNSKRKPVEKFAPGKAPTLDTLTKNPDFEHIPTGDKVAYLKELLRMQRAALGLSL